MPSNILGADTGFPQFTGQESTEQKLDTILNYLYMLLEQLRYTLRNLDSSNFNETGLSEITESIYASITDSYGNLTELALTAEGLAVRISNAEDSVTSLTLTAEELASSIKDAEGNISTLTQTAEEFASSIEDAEGNISALMQTATSVESRVSDAEGNINTITQSLEGVVYESSLADGTTTINGGCITTGTVSAEYIKLGGKMTVYETTDADAEAGGYIGYMTGSSGLDIETTGIGVCDITDTSYLIATDAGVRMTSGSNSFYVTSSSIVATGDMTCKNGLTVSGAATLNSTLAVTGATTLAGSVNIANGAMLRWADSNGTYHATFYVSGSSLYLGWNGYATNYIGNTNYATYLRGSTLYVGYTSYPTYLRGSNVYIQGTNIYIGSTLLDTYITNLVGSSGSSNISLATEAPSSLDDGEVCLVYV